MRLWARRPEFWSEASHLQIMTVPLNLLWVSLLVILWGWSTFLLSLRIAVRVQWNHLYLLAVYKVPPRSSESNLELVQCLYSPSVPWWLSGEESVCQGRRFGFDSQVGKIPWRRKWQPTPVFLPRKSCGQWSLAGCSPRSHRVRTQMSTQANTLF